MEPAPPTVPGLARLLASLLGRGGSSQPQEQPHPATQSAACQALQQWSWSFDWRTWQQQNLGPRQHPLLLQPVVLPQGVRAQAEECRPDLDLNCALRPAGRANGADLQLRLFQLRLGELAEERGAPRGRLKLPPAAAALLGVADRAAGLFLAQLLFPDSVQPALRLATLTWSLTAAAQLGAAAVGPAYRRRRLRRAGGAASASARPALELASSGLRVAGELVQRFGEPALALAIAAALWAYIDPSSYQIGQALAALVPVMAGYNQTAAQCSRGRIPEGWPTEEAWHARHKWAARRVAHLLTSLPDRPPLAPVLDACSGVNICVGAAVDGAAFGAGGGGVLSSWGAGSDVGGLRLWGSIGLPPPRAPAIKPQAAEPAAAVAAAAVAEVAAAAEVALEAEALREGFFTPCLPSPRQPAAEQRPPAVIDSPSEWGAAGQRKAPAARGADYSSGEDEPPLAFDDGFMHPRNWVPGIPVTSTDSSSCPSFLHRKPSSSGGSADGAASSSAGPSMRVADCSIDATPFTSPDKTRGPAAVGGGAAARPVAGAAPWQEPRPAEPGTAAAAVEAILAGPARGGQEAEPGTAAAAVEAILEAPARGGLEAELHLAAQQEPPMAALFGQGDHLLEANRALTWRETAALVARAAKLAYIFAPFLFVGVAMLVLASRLPAGDGAARRLRRRRQALGGPQGLLEAGALPEVVVAELNVEEALVAEAVEEAEAAVLSERLRLNAFKLLLRGCRGAGAAFIKWGQWSSSREDMFPEDFCRVLSELHDKAPEHSFAQTRATVELALGQPLEEAFLWFDPVPLASGSIAQVHRAHLPAPGGGVEEVVVKVRHPGVALHIWQDFQLLRPLAALTAHVPSLRGLNLKDSVSQFSHSMTAQADLRVEAAHVRRFYDNFLPVADAVVVPRLIPGYQSEAVLVETYEAGESVARYIRAPTPWNTSIVSLGVDTYLKMLLADNFVHTDLHPGNILVRLAPGGAPGAKPRPQLVLLDFGLAEELTPAVRYHFVSFLNMIAKGDGLTAAAHLLRWSTDQRCPDPAAFAADVVDLFAEACDIHSPAGIDLDAVMKSVLHLARKHEVSIDSNYAALVVGVCVIVGFATSLDPRVNLMDAAAPCFLYHSLTGRVRGRLYQ